MDLLQMTEQDLIDEFDFSHDRGFLPKTDPVTEFSLSLERGNRNSLLMWQQTARDLPYYLAQQNVRKKIESLPELSLEDLAPEEHTYTALLCSYFGPAYVFGENPIKPVVPRNIARLWCALSQPASLRYYHFCLTNWRLLDPNGPIAFGNLALLQTFLGGADENGFVLPHTTIEAKAGVLGDAFFQLLKTSYARNTSAARTWFQVACEAFVPILTTLRDITKWCDPDIYYKRVRPYLHWSKGNQFFPDGIVYEGCFDNKPVFLRGETGAQSSVIPLLDAFLGVDHPKDRLWDYLEDMKNYMHPKHRAFVEYLWHKHPYVIRGFVRDYPEFRDLYNQCIFNLYLFREIHRGHVKLYIEDQQERAGNPTAVGTGGTPLSEYLKAHSDNTLKALL